MFPLRYIRWLKRPWAPGALVALLILILTVVSPLDSAFILGGGVGGLTSPVLLLPVAIIGIGTTSWWQSILYASIAVLVNRLIYLTPIQPNPLGFDVAKQLASLFMSLVLIALISGVRDFQARKAK